MNLFNIFKKKKTTIKGCFLLNGIETAQVKGVVNIFPDFFFKKEKFGIGLNHMMLF